MSIRDISNIDAIRRKSIFILAVIFLLFSHISAQTTGKISGRVFDQRSGEGLLGTNIIVTELQTGTSSDADGNFTILRIYPGEYTLKISYVGYATATIKNVQVFIDRTTFLEIPLTVQGIEMQEVVVTARKPVIVKDKTYSSTSIDADQIRELPSEGLRDVLDLNTSLQRNPNGTYSLRGGGSFDINFMIDGVSQDNSNTGVPGTNYMGEKANTSWKYDFNPLGVKQMELISGGFSAEYGNAQSGVVKVVTKEGGREFHGDLRVEYRPSGQYHFGDYLYSKDNFEWQNWGDYENWIAWRDAKNPAVGNDSLTALYEKWIDTHTPSDDNVLGVYDYRENSYKRAMFGFGGPIGELPGWTFFLSGEKRIKPTRLPTYEKNEEYENLNLTTVFKLSDKLHLRSMYQYQHNRSGIFSGSNDVRWASVVGNVSFHTGQQKYLLTTVPPKDEFTWIESFDLTYALDQNSYFEFILSHTYEQYQINSEPLSTKWQVLQGEWDEGYTRLVWDPSATLYNQDVRSQIYALRGDYTNQITHRHLIKTGVQTTLRYLHYSSVSSAYANAFISKTGFAEYYNADPIYAVFYIQDRMEYKGLIANIGLRLEGFNNNVDMPADFYNPFYPGTGANAQGDPATVKPETHTALSPRLGLSFPIGEKTAFRLQYGHFYAMPIFRHTLSRSTWQGWIMYGNPNLGFRKTISYEFGVQHSLWGSHKLDIAAYYNDRTLQTVTIRRHFDTGSVGRSTTDPYAATYVNTGYGATRGIEVEFQKITQSRFRYQLKYSFSRTSAGAYGASEIWQADDPNKPFDLRPYIQRANDNITSLDKTHAFSVVLSYTLPARAGLHLGKIYPLQNMTSALTYTATSGIPYTYVTSYDEFFDVSNNRRYPLEYETNMSFSKAFRVKDYRVSFQCRIQNLFNNQWLTPFDGYVELDDLQNWVESGSTWADPSNPNYKYNYHRAYRNIPREIYFSLGIGF